MTEEREQCCGTCWWWIKYRSQEGGWCYRDLSDMLAVEGCSRWEKEYHREEEDDHDEEEVEHGP